MAAVSGSSCAKLLQSRLRHVVRRERACGFGEEVREDLGEGPRGQLVVFLALTMARAPIFSSFAFMLPAIVSCWPPLQVRRRLRERPPVTGSLSTPPSREGYSKVYH